MKNKTEALTDGDQNLGFTIGKLIEECALVL